MTKSGPSCQAPIDALMKKRRSRTSTPTPDDRAESLEQPVITAGVRLWVDVNETSFLGRGRIELLRRIETYGSISAAARSLNMSYRTAWKHIESMNRISSSVLVETEIGGHRGGGSQLTPLGKELIEIFTRFSDTISSRTKRMETEIAELIGHETNKINEIKETR